MSFCSAAHKIMKGRFQGAVTKRGIEVVIRIEIGTERGNGTGIARSTKTERRVVTETEIRKKAGTEKGIAIEKRTAIATGIATGIAVREGSEDETEMMMMIIPAVKIMIGNGSISRLMFVFISCCIFSCIP